MSLLAACTSEHLAGLDQLKKDVAATQDASQRKAHVDAFMQQVTAKGTPLLENDTTAVFMSTKDRNRRCGLRET